MIQSLKQYGKFIAVLFALAVSIATFFLTGCGGKAQPLRVGMSMDYIPYSYVESNRYVGFDVELAEYLAIKLNRQVEIVKSDFPKIFDLLNDKADVLVSAISITEDRANKCDFSVPYSTARFAFMFKKENLIDSLDDLKGKKIGVVVDTTMHQWCKENSETLDFSIELYDNNLQLVGDDRAQKIDAALVEEQNAKSLIKKFPEYQYSVVSPDNKNSEFGFGVAVKKGDKDLLQKINNILESTDGKAMLEKLTSRWLRVEKEVPFIKQKTDNNANANKTPVPSEKVAAVDMKMTEEVKNDAVIKAEDIKESASIPEDFQPLEEKIEADKAEEAPNAEESKAEEETKTEEVETKKAD